MSSPALRSGRSGCPTGFAGPDCAPLESSDFAIEAADAVRFQAWVRWHQNPRDCGKATGAVQERSYFWRLGLGAQLVSLKFGLLRALLHGHVFHLPDTHYTNPVGCPDRSFSCYFERPSQSCTVSSHRSVVRDSIHWCGTVPAANLEG